MRRRALEALVVASVTAATPEATADDGIRPQFFAGEASPPAEDYAVKLTTPGACSGVLVSPTLILTARHCVVRGNISFDSYRVHCEVGTELQPPEVMTVAFGPDAQRFVKVKRAFTEVESNDCRYDMAALELAEPVTDIAPPPLLLDSTVAAGKPGPCTSNDDPTCLTFIGWGHFNANRDGTESTAYRRSVRGRVLALDGGTVQLSTGQTLDEPQGGFLVSEAPMCRGDSGGPALDRTGALVAINVGRDEPGGNYICGPVAVTLSLRLDQHRGFIERAFQAVGRMPHRAGRPPPSELGGACAENNECHSNYCVHVGKRGVCSQRCDTSQACPSPLECTDTGAGFAVCLDPPLPADKPSSCAAAPSRVDAGAYGQASAFACVAAAAALVLRASRKGGAVKEKDRARRRRR